jgi:hypothetical protein
MKEHEQRLKRWTLVAAALLSGGTLFGTCEMRFRDAVVDGSKTFALSLFDVLAQSIIPEPESDETTP